MPVDNLWFSLILKRLVGCCFLAKLFAIFKFSCLYFQETVKQIVVGICAMAKKTQSKPMHEILSRLEMFEYITVEIFDESVILEKSVSEWPHCDCLISFQSSGKFCLLYCLLLIICAGYIC